MTGSTSGHGGRATPRMLHVFPGFGPGGSQVRTVRLIDASADRIDHLVLALNDDLHCADRAPGRLTTLAASELGGTGVPGLVSLVRRQRPDVVCTYNWGAIEAAIAARIAGAPVIHHEDGFNPDEMDRQKRRRVLARRLLLRGTAAVVVPSRTLRKIALQSWRLPPSRVRTILNGIDTDRFHPGNGRRLRDRLGLGAEERLIGTVGHLNPGKNIDMLLRAVATISGPGPLPVPPHVVVLGDGPDRDRLAALGQELGLADRMHLVGQVEDPAPWYRAMDLYASTSRTEQMPLSVLEAMATGLAVVATDVGDVRRMVVDANRDWLVPRDDLDGFTAATASLLDDLALRLEIGNANARRARAEYSLAGMIDAHLSLWDEVLHGAEASDRLEASRTS